MVAAPYGRAVPSAPWWCGSRCFRLRVITNMSKNKLNLFDDSDDDDGGDTSLSINKDYAKRYEEWREAEVKRHLEDKYGDAHEDVSSSSSDDDPDPEELKRVMSKDFFEVISNLRKKDPKIYNSEVQFFQSEKAAAQNPGGSTSKQTKEKPIYLRDYERKLITERQGELSDDSDSENITNPRSHSPTYVEEQRQLKESFRKALHDDDDSDDEGGLLKKKEKTKEEKEKEEEDYIEWLKGNKESLPDQETEKSLEHLKSIWTDPKLDEGEKFLRDYVLNKRYLDDSEPADTGNVTDEDYQDEYMNEFERKYNFRYEEPDREFLKRYPRTMEQSMRQKDTRRKEKRDAVKQRKEEEKQRKREELKVLKSLKRKEILQKIEKIKEITGNDQLGLNPDELEDDFDPEAHDRKMREMFNDDYYGEADEAEGEDGLNLPPLEEELLNDGIDDGDWDNWDGTEDNVATVKTEEGGDATHCEDPNFNMDCDYDPATAVKDTTRKSAREKRKLKRQSRFGRLVHKEKPVFDPKDKTFQEYVDEYYGMDYEDLIGDIPCRFKYKTVFPNNFGLTIDEILAADDKELNQWASIKKAYTIRSEDKEKYEAKIYAQKAQDEELKRKILPSLYKQETENINQEDDKGKKKKKKKNKNKPVSDESESMNMLEEASTEIKPKKKAKTGDTVVEDTNEPVEQDPSEPAEGTGKKKKKKKNKEFKNSQANGNHTESESQIADQQSSETKLESSGKKKKKKDFNKNPPTAQTNSNEPLGKKNKRKRADSGMEHQNGGKKARRSFGQGDGTKKNFKNRNGQGNAEQDISDSRLKAFGLNPKKFKNKMKYGNKK